MKGFESQNIDHEYWARLWKEDPAAFEAERTRVIEAFINSFPEHNQPRLRSFQWRIDMVRRRCKTPLAATLRLYAMMVDSLLGDRGLITALHSLRKSVDQKADNLHSARVLSFRFSNRSKEHS